jgi:hypothetical protein
MIILRLKQLLMFLLICFITIIFGHYFNDLSKINKLSEYCIILIGILIVLKIVVKISEYNEDIIIERYMKKKRLKNI